MDTKKKVRVSMSPKDLETVIKSLRAVEDYSRIEKVLDIPVTKETMEFLCKSSLVLDWDFVDAESQNPIEKVPEVKAVVEPEPSPFLSSSNLEKIEEVIFPLKKNVTEEKKDWEDEFKDLVNLFIQYFPSTLSSENALSFLMAIQRAKIEDPGIELTTDTIANKVVPIFQNVSINKKDKVFETLLDYLDLMLGHQSNKEQCSFFLERVHGVWNRIQNYEGIVELFEATFSIKIAGVK